MVHISPHNYYITCYLGNTITCYLGNTTTHFLGNTTTCFLGNATGEEILMYLLGTFCLSAVKCVCVYAQYHAYQIQDTILLGAQFFSRGDTSICAARKGLNQNSFSPSPPPFPPPFPSPFPPHCLPTSKH